MRLCIQQPDVGPVFNLNGYLPLICFIILYFIFVGGFEFEMGVGDENKEAASTMTNHGGHEKRSVL